MPASSDCLNAMSYLRPNETNRVRLVMMYCSEVLECARERLGPLCRQRWCLSQSGFDLPDQAHDAGRTTQPDAFMRLSKRRIGFDPMPVFNSYFPHNLAVGRRKSPLLHSLSRDFAILSNGCLPTSPCFALRTGQHYQLIRDRSHPKAD